MKKAFSLLLVLCLLLCMTAGCSDADKATHGSTPADEAQHEVSERNTELIVFAAASLTETMTEIAETYKKTAPDV